MDTPYYFFTEHRAANPNREQAVPDEAVTGAVRTVFERFAEFGSARCVWERHWVAGRVLARYTAFRSRRSRGGRMVP
jgi:predicted nicotinamide N-methyase